jgi:hypothetical protein
LFLFNLISDYVFNGKDVKRNLEIFVESKFPFAKNYVLDWLISTFDEYDCNYEMWEHWIREYLGTSYAERFKRKINKIKLLSTNVKNDHTNIVNNTRTSEKFTIVKTVFGDELEVKSFESFVMSLKSYTGVIKGVSNDRVALAYLKDGKITHAKVKLDGEVYKGFSALYYFDFPAKVFMNSSESLDDDCKIPEIVTDRNKLIKKYGIKVPKDEEIDVLLSSLTKERKDRFIDKFKLFKRKK